jgi:hypothetical protein
MTSWCGWLCFSKQIRARISLCRTSPTFPFRDSSGGGQPLGCPRDFSAMFPRNPNGYPREAFPGWIKRRSLEGADDDHHQRVGQGGEQARSAGSATPRPTRWVLRSYTSMSRSCCHSQPKRRHPAPAQYRYSTDSVAFALHRRTAEPRHHGESPHLGQLFFLFGKTLGLDLDMDGPWNSREGRQNP